MKRHSIYFFILFISTTGCTPVGFTNLGNGVYEHKYSGIVFPQQIGDFKRTPIRNYGPNGQNVGVGYNLRKPDCRITFTMYVYPTHKMDIESEYDKVKHSINYFRNNPELESEKEVVYQQDNDLKANGLEATYTYYENFKGKNILHESIAQLYEYEDRFIKYRITYPKFQNECKRDIWTKLMKELKWNGN